MDSDENNCLTELTTNFFISTNELTNSIKKLLNRSIEFEHLKEMLNQESDAQKKKWWKLQLENFSKSDFDYSEIHSAFTTSQNFLSKIFNFLNLPTGLMDVEETYTTKQLNTLTNGLISFYERGQEDALELIDRLQGFEADLDQELKTSFRYAAFLMLVSYVLKEIHFFTRSFDMPKDQLVESHKTLKKLAKEHAESLVQKETKTVDGRRKEKYRRTVSQKSWALNYVLGFLLEGLSKKEQEVFFTEITGDSGSNVYNNRKGDNLSSSDKSEINEKLDATYRHIKSKISKD